MPQGRAQIVRDRIRKSLKLLIGSFKGRGAVFHAGVELLVDGANLFVGIVDLALATLQALSHVVERVAELNQFGRAGDFTGTSIEVSGSQLPGRSRQLTHRFDKKTGGVIM